jgi:hypothetical protein
MRQAVPFWSATRDLVHKQKSAFWPAQPVDPVLADRARALLADATAAGVRPGSAAPRRDDPNITEHQDPAGTGWRPPRVSPQTAPNGAAQHTGHRPLTEVVSLRDPAAWCALPCEPPEGQQNEGVRPNRQLPAAEHHRTLRVSAKSPHDPTGHDINRSNGLLGVCMGVSVRRFRQSITPRSWRTGRRPATNTPGTRATVSMHVPCRGPDGSGESVSGSARAASCHVWHDLGPTPARALTKGSACVCGRQCTCIYSQPYRNVHRWWSNRNK